MSTHKILLFHSIFLPLLCKIVSFFKKFFSFSIEKLSFLLYNTYAQRTFCSEKYIRCAKKSIFIAKGKRYNKTAMITFDKNCASFFLEGDAFSYVFCIDEYARPVSLHYGSKIGRDDLRPLLRKYDRGFSANFAGAKSRADSLDSTPVEYPVYGNGDFRFGAFLTVDAAGNRLEDLRYVGHSITDQKPAPNTSMPFLRGENTQTLILTLASKNVEVKLFYTVYEKENALVRRAELKNISAANLSLSRIQSCSVDLPDMDFDFISLWGKHCGERSFERTKLRHGIQSVYSNRGASSHQHNPFCMLARANTDESSGEVYGFNLVYCGNFTMSAECDQYNTTRVSAGISDYDFKWDLAPQEVFLTPETVCVYSADGFTALSQSFHDLYREHMLPKRFAQAHRPVVINNWEATYFDFDTDKLCALIDESAKLGVDTFVLDDGWFGKRDDDNSGLGDWFVNEKKLKGGLAPLIDHCKKRGLSFGLWFEPEMISRDSDLFRKHPDWCLHIPGIEPSTSRNQLVLDLSKAEVVQYLKQAVGNILSAYDISYVKWDFNRHLTDVYSDALPPQKQQEVSHRYVLGFYELARYLTETFPHVLFEGCSGGGGRFDPSMLAFFPQSWTSDNSDAYSRTRIQYGTSFAYPLSCMTGHVSVCPNHQTGRVSPLSARVAIAQTCIYGYELNPSTLSEEDKTFIQKQTELYKKIEPLILNGDLYRLLSPFDTRGEFAEMIVSKDKTQAVLTVMRPFTETYMPVRYLKLRGLDENKRYRIAELNLSLSGKTLLGKGIPLEPVWGDFTASVYHITEV